VLDPLYPQDVRRSALLSWDLDDPGSRDLLHRLVGLLAEADCAVAERFLRHLVLTARLEPGQPVILVAGPLAKDALEQLADQIARLPVVSMRHRLIRSGFCRMDGWTMDVDVLCAHLALVPGVAEVRKISDTIYVLPYPDSEGRS
jgi:hypothetical protein